MSKIEDTKEIEYIPFNEYIIEVRLDGIYRITKIRKKSKMVLNGTFILHKIEDNMLFISVNDRKFSGTISELLRKLRMITFSYSYYFLKYLLNYYIMKHKNPLLLNDNKIIDKIKEFQFDIEIRNNGIYRRYPDEYNSDYKLMIFGSFKITNYEKKSISDNIYTVVCNEQTFKGTRSKLMKMLSPYRFEGSEDTLKFLFNYYEKKYYEDSQSQL